MQLVTKKDAKAFSEIYDRYGKKMLNYFHRMLWKDKEKAEDFMQDLFVKIIEKPQMFDASRPFKTWLYSIANNMCKNEYKKQEIRRDKHEILTRELDNSIQDDFSENLDFREFNVKLDQELQKLDENHRSTFIMRYKEDLTIKEISEIMECSEGTVKSRLFYSLKKLTPHLQVFNPKFDNLYYEQKK